MRGWVREWIDVGRGSNLGEGVVVGGVGGDGVREGVDVGEGSTWGHRVDEGAGLSWVDVWGRVDVWGQG